MKRFMLRMVSALLCVTFLAAQSGFSCTIFRLKSQDGAVVIGRSNEFGYDLKSQWAVFPRSFEISSPAPDGKEGLKWKTKYGFVGANGLGVDKGIFDGVNEKGLAASALMFPGFAEYQAVKPKEMKKALANWMLTTWILSQCATVDDVKKSIKEVVVFLNKPDVSPAAFPLHFAVFDARGGAIVIEYVNGELKVYDNPVNVMTNSPGFDWHLLNLKNYLKLTNVNASPLRLQGYQITGFGQGTGMLGVPGDYTSPSRFIRAAFWANSALMPQNALDGVNLAFHILGSFDIPLGVVADKSAPQRTYYEGTAWITVRDVTNKILYFRTYENFAIGKIDLKKLDFSQKSVKHITFDCGEPYFDKTSSVK